MIITTKYLGPTNTRPGAKSRKRVIKASREDGLNFPPVTVEYDPALGTYANHCEAMRAFIRKHYLKTEFDTLLVHHTKEGYMFLTCADTVTL
jgi:hypothetical protein